MSTDRGAALIDDPVARDLLQSKHLAHLASVWADGTPRVVPIWFQWTGTEVVVAGFSDGPRMEALRDGTRVALEIDDDAYPGKLLLIRGPIRAQIVDGIAPEFAAAAERYMGTEAGQAFVEQGRPLFRQMARVAIIPEWVKILDFEERFPSPYARGPGSGTGVAMACGSFSRARPQIGGRSARVRTGEASPAAARRSVVTPRRR